MIQKAYNSEITIAWFSQPTACFYTLDSPNQPNFRLISLTI